MRKRESRRSIMSKHTQITMKNAVEHCWLVVGRRCGPIWLGARVQLTTGSRTRVGFDPHWAIEREESVGDVVGFYHTHPGGSRTPSQRDENTMRSWTDAFGKPLLCFIEAAGRVSGFLYEDFTDEGRPVSCVPFPRGFIAAYDRGITFRGL